MRMTEEEALDYYMSRKSQIPKCQEKAECLRGNGCFCEERKNAINKIRLGRL